MKRRYPGESLQLVEMLCTDKIEFGGNITSMNTRDRSMHYLRKCLKILESWLPLIPSLAPRQRGNLFGEGPGRGT